MAEAGAQLSELLPDQDIDGHCSFIDERAEWVLYGASDALMALHPSVEFRITTGGGADIPVSAREISLEGVAWLGVREIALDGGEALELTWMDEDTWSVRVPLEDGPNTITLVATDLHGARASRRSASAVSNASTRLYRCFLAEESDNSSRLSVAGSPAGPRARPPPAARDPRGAASDRSDPRSLPRARERAATASPRR